MISTHTHKAINLTEQAKSNRQLVAEQLDDIQLFGNHYTHRHK